LINFELDRSFLRRKTLHGDSLIKANSKPRNENPELLQQETGELRCGRKQELIQEGPFKFIRTENESWLTEVRDS
jgi:hypothetical protein